VRVPVNMGLIFELYCGIFEGRQDPIVKVEVEVELLVEINV
jgi:hypothetical protein